MTRGSTLAAIALSSLLSACANDHVVVEPVGLAPVARDLMRAPGVPKCDLPDRASYRPGEITAYALCWKSAYHALAARHIGLQMAVGVRERVTSRAVKASKI